MNETLDAISPDTIGEDKIGIAVDASSLPLLVNRAITLHFDYSATFPEGVVRPLKLQVQPAFGDGTGYFEVEFHRNVPRSYAFTLRSAGKWLVLLREIGHNSWQGRAVLDVGGDPHTQTQISRG